MYKQRIRFKWTLSSLVLLIHKNSKVLYIIIIYLSLCITIHNKHLHGISWHHYFHIQDTLCNKVEPAVVQKINFPWQQKGLSISYNTAKSSSCFKKLTNKHQGWLCLCQVPVHLAKTLQLWSSLRILIVTCSLVCQTTLGRGKRMQISGKRWRQYRKETLMLHT